MWTFVHNLLENRCCGVAFPANRGSKVPAKDAEHVTEDHGIPRQLEWDSGASDGVLKTERFDDAFFGYREKNVGVAV